MSELASAYPTAGGIYYWASKLGGAGWGWFTGWFNLIGLIAVVASVDYAAATFLKALLGLYNVHFIFNFAKAAAFSDVHYSAHVNFALFGVIIIIHGLINVFSSHLVSRFNSVSVWWHVIGVAVIVVILLFVPSHHQSFSFVFGHRINNSGFSQHVLVLRAAARLPADDVHDHRLRRLGARLRGDPRRRQAAPKGVWRSVFYSAVIGWIVLLAITFAATNPRSDEQGKASGALPIFATAQTGAQAAAKAVILISVVGQLFCGVACLTSASRMSFAFSRDGAVPGPQALAPAELKTNADVGESCSSACSRSSITVPAYFPNKLGTPVAFLAVTSISVIGLYIAYTIPMYLRWRMGDAFEAGPWTLGKKYKWINPIAIVWVALYTIIGSLPFPPEAVFFKSGFNWSSVNYAPLVTIGVIAGGHDLVVSVGETDLHRARSGRSTSSMPSRGRAARHRAAP